MTLDTGRLCPRGKRLILEKQSQDGEGTRERKAAFYLRDTTYILPGRVAWANREKTTAPIKAPFVLRALRQTWTREREREKERERERKRLGSGRGNCKWGHCHFRGFYLQTKWQSLLSRAGRCLAEVKVRLLYSTWLTMHAFTLLRNSNSCYMIK